MKIWLEQLPKVKLHVHLEGAIPLPALWERVQKYGGDPTTPTLEALEARFEYRDFPQSIWDAIHCLHMVFPLRNPHLV